MTSTSPTNALQTKKCYQENAFSSEPEAKILQSEFKPKKFKVDAKEKSVEPQKHQSAKNYSIFSQKKGSIGMAEELTKKLEKAFPRKERKFKSHSQEEDVIMVYEKEMIAYNGLLETKPSQEEEIVIGTQQLIQDVPESEVHAKKMVAQSKSLKEVNDCKKSALNSFKASAYFGRSSNSFDLGFSFSSSGDLSRFRKNESFATTNKTILTKSRLNNYGCGFQGNRSERIDMTGVWKESSIRGGSSYEYSQGEEAQNTYHSLKNSPGPLRKKQEIIDEFLNNDIFDEICNDGSYI